MTKNAKKLYIIDGHAHIYSAYYAPMRPMLSPAGEPTKVGYVFTNMLLGLIDRQKPDMLVVTMDSKGPCFRADIFPDYKAHRKPMPEDMPVQIDRVVEIVEAMGIPILKVKGFEADDLIGTLCKQASAKGIDTYICSKDKDMLQLLDEHVRTFDVKKKIETTPEVLHENMGVTPAQFLDVLALQGDTADNVPGVPGIGGSAVKLCYSELYQRISELGMRVLGRAALSREDVAERPSRRILSRAMQSLSLTIAAGSSPIQRNIIAERILGLPKDR